MVTTGLSVWKYWHFADISDVHIFENVLWNTVHGRILHSGMLGMNSLGDHVSPSLLVVAVVYGLWQSPITLIVLQRVLFALSALVLYRIAERILGSPRAACALALALLAYAPLHAVNLESFTPVGLAVPALLWMFWCYEAKSRWLWVAVVLALGVKENVPLAVAPFGLYVALFRRDWRRGAVLMALAGVWLAAAVWVVIPHFAGASFDATMTGRFFGATLGGSLGEAVRFVFTHPLDTAQIALRPEQRMHALRLFGPLLFVALAAPEVLLCAAPILLQNLLASREGMASTLTHYHAVAIPGMMYATVYGLRRVARGASKVTGFSAGRAARLLTWAVMACCLLNLPLSRTARHMVTNAWDACFEAPLMSPERAVTARRLMARLPKRSAIACSLNLVNHLAGRGVFWRDFRVLSRLREVAPEWVLLDMKLGAVEGIAHAMRDLKSLEGFLAHDYECRERTELFVLLKRGQAPSAARFAFSPQEVEAYWAATWERARCRHEAEPGRPGRLRNAAAVLLEAGQAASAASLLEKGIARAQPRAYLHVALAAAYRECGRSDAAVSALRRALALDPSHETARQMLQELTHSTSIRHGPQPAPGDNP